ncbi:STN domain-containing protein [Xanthomonas campestris pv. phormiicola]|nr:STN domain-containing protein [Xanthomonas campestris pv. phormiicola]UYC17393.1 STN domain-containing protein [Xanthomonas campestris pv. phormiicola]
MGKVATPFVLLLALVVFGVPACSRADPAKIQFDIPEQVAATALNEFARQADITLIFAYDVVDGIQTRPLQGTFTVDEGLSRLLGGTPLTYRRSHEGLYLVCRSSACGALVSFDHLVDDEKRPRKPPPDGGFGAATRLYSKPVARPETYSTSRGRTHPCKTIL